MYRKTKANINLAGDTNINLLKMHENKMYCYFCDLLMAHNLYPHIILRTRFSDKNVTLIDQTYSVNYFQVHKNIALG